jgi:micrococcal nuclease
MRKLIILGILLLLPSLAEGKEREYHTVTKVIDGMTLELDGNETVRLIGASTPDLSSTNPTIQQWGEKAKQFTQALLEGRKVWLEYGKKKQDEQGQTWAFVFFSAKLREMQPLIDRSFLPFWGTSGDFMLNRVLVQFGFATVKSPFSFPYRSQFSDLEKRARQREFGMWQDLKY